MSPDAVESQLQQPQRSKLRIPNVLTKPSWLYPFKGVFYFSTHRYLWPLMRSQLLPCLILSLVVFTLLFVWTYLPQALLLLPFHGRAAFFNAAVLVLGEGATIVTLLFEAFLVDDTLAQVFDAVLVAHGLESLVQRGREVLPEEQAGPDPLQRLSSPLFASIYSPFSFKQIAEFILLLPLNLVPFVGVPVFVLLTGARAGPLHHHRYFRLRGLTRKQRGRETKRRRLRYTWFGSTALILQLVPGLSMLFLMTTAAGSALWVADIESEKKKTGGEEIGAQRVAERAEGIYAAVEDDPLLESGNAV